MKRKEIKLYSNIELPTRSGLELSKRELKQLPSNSIFHLGIPTRHGMVLML